MTEPKWWDFTMSREPTFTNGSPNPWSELTTDELGKWFMMHGAERCVIGEEEGKDGYKHWQGRIVFQKPTSMGYVVGLVNVAHWTPTQVRNFDYCEKEGNFWRSWEGALRKFQTMEMYPWQNEVLDRLMKQGDRRICVLVDEYGASGKTTLAKMITARHLGAYCPAMDESKDYMAWALAHSSAGIFVMDIPKSDSRKKNADLWSAVEQMKNGYVWDKRNHWQERWIDPPGILVITNEEPDRTLLSADRWDIGHMEKGLICGNKTNTIQWERGNTQ
nr:MAG: replication associated protein [ssDNA virus sp.]